MATLSYVAPLIWSAILTSGLAQTGPSGHWEGTVRLPNRQNQIAVDLKKDDKGTWIGAFAQPTENVRYMPLSDIRVDDQSVKFRIAANRSNVPAFDCKPESPIAMRCTLTSYFPGGPVTVRMRRTGTANVDVPKASTAVSAELEGNWEGSLDTAAGAVMLVIHFKNQGKTVQATIDSPGPNSTQLPLTDVVQRGSAVEFQLRVTGARFKGAMNPEGSFITGEWIKGGTSTPVTLKKFPPKYQ